jgi:uncharacterized protein (DUF4213/DUF364 family)
VAGVSLAILEDLIASLGATDTRVRAVCAGARFTAVTTRHTGLATTYRPDPSGQAGHAPLVKDAGALLEKTGAELAGYALSEDTLSASLGLAAINSLLDVDTSACRERGAYEILAAQGRDRDVAVVGHFPFVTRLRPLTRELWVFEKRLRPGDLPASEAGRILPRCQVVCITGTSLINHTLQELLELCRGSYVVLTGPTSPLSPILFDHGVDVVCGTQVVDGEMVHRLVSQAAGFRQIHGPAVRLLAMARNPAELDVS